MRAKEKAAGREAFTGQEPPAETVAAEKPKRGRKPKKAEKQEADRTAESGEAGTENPVESKTNDVPENGEKTEPGTDSDVRTEMPGEPERQVEETGEAAPHTDTEPESELETEDKSEPESKDKSGLESENKPGDKSEPESETESGPESEGKPEPAPCTPEEKPAAVTPVQSAGQQLRRMNQEFHERSQIIKEQMLNIQNAFITIGFQLRWIRNNKMYRVLNYKNIYEYAEKEYGIRKTTCSNFISIIENYAERDTDGEVVESIAGCYRNYSASQLVAMLGMPEEMKQQVTPDMSVRAINRMRRGDGEKTAAEPAVSPAAVPAAEPSAKEAGVPEKGIMENAMENAGETTAEIQQTEETGHSTWEEETPEPEENSVGTAMEDAAPEAETDNVEITGADDAGITGTDNKEITGADNTEITKTEKPPEENHAAGMVGTLVEIDSYTVYQSISGKIDAMMRHVFSASIPVKVRIVCEQG